MHIKSAEQNLYGARCNAARSLTIEHCTLTQMRTVLGLAQAAGVVTPPPFEDPEHPGRVCVRITGTLEQLQTIYEGCWVAGLWQ